MRKESRPSNKLQAQHKQYICRLFAEFCTPTEVRAAVKAEFGIDISLQGVHYYKGRQPWATRIAEMRKALNAHLDELPICSKYWRLKQLHELYVSENRYRVTRYSGRSETPIEEKPVGELRQILALAAEELGELKMNLAGGASGAQRDFVVRLGDGAEVPVAHHPRPASVPAADGA